MTKLRDYASPGARHRTVEEDSQVPVNRKTDMRAGTGTAAVRSGKSMQRRLLEKKGYAHPSPSTPAARQDLDDSYPLKDFVTGSRGSVQIGR